MMDDSVKESSQNSNSTKQIDQTLNVVVTSSIKHSKPTLQNSHHDALALKDQLASLEKISEIDENESRAISSVSRPISKHGILTQSQATLRSASRKDNLEEDDLIEEDNEIDDLTKRNSQLNCLITQPKEDGSSNDGSDSDDLEYDDDNDVVSDVKKKPNYILYSNENIYNDQDWETDLDDEEEVTEEEHNPKEVYKKMCDNLKVIPCRYFMAHIDNQKLTMKYHQFSNEEIRAISKPLWNNLHVEKLHLDGNWIEYAGAKYLSRMIRMNDFITELSIADNRLGEETDGVYEVCRMVSENCILRKLNLSGNCFSDRDIEMLTTALEKNRLLKDLDLSHNHLGDEAGKFLGQFIAQNDTLEVLDLSWNNFRNKACKDIANGIKENVRLKEFNISFNGFDEAGKVLAEVIKQNNTLEIFNISNTRLNAEAAAAIANSLEQNESLKDLNMSNNPITTSGALTVIYAVKLNSTSVMKSLDLSEIPITKEFENVLKDIQENNPEFKCLRGPVISTSNTKSVFYGEGNKVDFEKILESLKNK